MKKSVRVDIPRNADELIELGEGIIEVYNANPTDSPLQALDMAEFATRVGDAKARNAEAKKLRRDSETATQDRDDLLGIKEGQRLRYPRGGPRHQPRQFLQEAAGRQCAGEVAAAALRVI